MNTMEPLGTPLFEGRSKDVKEAKKNGPELTQEEEGGRREEYQGPAQVLKEGGPRAPESHSVTGTGSRNTRRRVPC